MKVRITSLGGMLSVGCRMALSSSGASMCIDMIVRRTETIGRIRQLNLNVAVVAGMEPLAAQSGKNVVTNPDYAELHPGYSLYSE